MSVTGPSPLWSTGTPEHGRADVADTWDPSATDFGEFVSAIAKRYSGSCLNRPVFIGGLLT